MSELLINPFVFAVAGRNQWSVDLPGTAGGTGVPGPDFLSNANLLPTTNFTIFTWLYVRVVNRAGVCRWGTDVNNEATMLRFGSGVGGATNDIQFANTNTGQGMRSSTQPIAADTWCSVGVTMQTNYQDANSQLYKDGSQLTKLVDNGAMVTTTGDFAIGWGTTSGDAPIYTNPFDGYFAMFLAWNSILTAAEITEIHNAGAGVDASSNFGNYTSSANLIRSWMMEEGTGTTTADEVSSANDLTLNGSAAWYDQTGGAGGPP